MSHKNIKGADVDTLLRYYAEAAASHGQASSEGDYKTANSQYKTIAAVYRELRARGTEAQLTLLSLLEETDPNVRVWAATHALEFAPERGEFVLTTLSRSEGLSKLNAEMTLKEWRKGSLRFP